MSIEHLLADLSEEDRANFTRAVSSIGSAFASLTGVQPTPEQVAALPQIRDHVLAGLDLDISAGVDALKDVPELSNQLIAKQVKQAEVAKIQADIEHMRPDQRMTYARERGLERPRDDTTSSMTANEHAAVLAQLSPQQRINYARRHGIA